jgi:3-deoxy-D-manno-octulosonate 8-phosphate phosphatase (KDO 8-P phosphatase)
MSDKIRLFVTDIDGTLTDGTYFVHKGVSGYGRGFYTRDFMGMMLLHDAGIKVAAITSAADASVAQFERASPYIEVHTSAIEKKRLIERRYVLGEKYKWSEIAFIGDDIIDLDMLRAVGLAACPSDAEDEVKAVINSRHDAWVMDRAGGRGAVREFVNLIRRLDGIKTRWDGIIPERESI